MAEEWKHNLNEELQDPEFAMMYGADRARSAFGTALNKARQKSNLTQKQLAEKAGVTQPYIAELESGEANPSLETAGRIMAILGQRIIIGIGPLSLAEEGEISTIYSPEADKLMGTLIRDKQRKHAAGSTPPPHIRRG
jgi:transcriptional regulator with XRE-family HTH domain